MKKEWASALWQRLKDLYGQKWMSLFQGAEAIESWIVTWSSLECEASEISYALSRLPAEFPEWPPTFGQFRALIQSKPKPVLPAPKYERAKPTPEQAAELERFAQAVKGPRGNFWTPEVVVNDEQRNWIVIQASRFGPLSAAGRFREECEAAGVMGNFRGVS